MAEYLYRLKNLVCSYGDNRPVLEVENLEIPIGNLIVFVGKSGAGKSTMLETLRLMNRTIYEGEIYFYPNKEETIKIHEVWGDPDLLSEIRNKYYSFIFQNTNLMSNFTAVENACIPQLLQGIPMIEAVNEVRTVMKQVGINDIDNRAKVYELSGGQKQRIAFVRAITPGFTVLFGDEPTGNLDKANSRELLRVIKEAIRKKHRSSIIVSHDINLSLEFADQIIVISMKNSTGQILKENLFTSRVVENRRLWFDHNNAELDNLKEILEEKMY